MPKLEDILRSDPPAGDYSFQFDSVVAYADKTPGAIAIRGTIRSYDTNQTYNVSIYRSMSETQTFAIANDLYALGVDLNEEIPSTDDVEAFAELYRSLFEETPNVDVLVKVTQRRDTKYTNYVIKRPTDGASLV